MTLTIELPPEAEHAVAVEARRLGVPVETCVADLLVAWAADAEDVAEAERVLCATKPGDWVSWEQAKVQLAANRRKSNGQ